MATRDFTITFFVDQPPKEAFDAINNVRSWWTEELKGSSQKLNDEFTVRFFDDIQVTTQKVVELVPEKKVVWLVTKSALNFLKDKNEWKGTKICFEIAEKDSNRTQIHFTHLGLVPESECYEDCFIGWNRYINGSLLKLITSGKGNPELKSTSII
ncbi:MAG TPA: SRPBCC domain-containing protein [Cyclobacteriaceae bacterium]